MARVIKIPVKSDERGNLSFLDPVSLIGFSVERVFFIYGVTATRGGHRHKKTKMALIASGGPVKVFVQSPKANQTYNLQQPDECLILDPEDWHEMEFSSNSSLMVLASHRYDPDDYITERYR